MGQMIQMFSRFEFQKAVKAAGTEYHARGTSRNALLSQLWIALIAYLLLSYLKFKSRFKWSIYTLCTILPANLFARRNLWDWLNAPYHEKAFKPPTVQLQLAFG